MSIVYLNGEYLPATEAKISVFDRGFLFGDSVYEVIPFYQGIGFRLSEHLTRLEYSLRALQIKPHLQWEPILNELVRRNGGGNLSVYLQVTRGAAEKRTHSYDDTMQPTVFACCTPIKDIYTAGADDVAPMKVIVTADLRWHRCDVKCNGLLPNILVVHQANAQNADEALMMRDGKLTEGASCNVFVIQQGVIYTPKRGSEILGGTTRELIMQLADEHTIPWQEVDIDYEMLKAADEVWISSSTRGVVPVIEIDGEPVGDGDKGPLWRTMFELFIRYQQQLMTGKQ
ncbi:aminotransferase class IV [Pontibacterium sp.]|uniref:aminotransferase class IV n=1 Tax=Pontibacterium sp. TaxID=2036026 RepID=UPI0035179543